MVDWAVLSDEQMRKKWPFSLLNDEQMSNKVGVEHQPVDDFPVEDAFSFMIWTRHTVARRGTMERLQESQKK